MIRIYIYYTVYTGWWFNIFTILWDKPAILWDNASIMEQYMANNNQQSTILLYMYDLHYLHYG